jgi:electron transport complex protein RnfD
MAFIYAMAFYYYGPRVLALLAVSAVTSCLCELLAVLISRKRINHRDLSPLVTGMLLPLLMPASIDYSVVIVAAAFAILVAKHPFGGTGHNVFNPAAAGYSFAAICFTEAMFLYPQPREWLPVLGKIGEMADITLTNSPAFTLQLGGVPKYELVEVLLGNYPGPMGATNILVILACLLYLMFRNTVRWEIPVFFFAAASVTVFLAQLSGLAPREGWMTALEVLPYELCSGVFLLGGVYMMGDPVTSPKRDWSKIAYAVTAGILVMLFRRFGGMEEGFTFAILLMNAAVWGFDMLGERVASLIRRRRGAA